MTDLRSIVAAAALMCCVGSSSAGVVYTFYNITNNSPINAAAGEAQLFVEVSGVGSEATFRFTNVGPAEMAITDVYFQDGPLLGISAVVNGPGVLFMPGAEPSNLPGGNMATPPFVATQGFSADSEPPTLHNGVGVGEWLEITFQLLSGQTVNEVIAALNNGSVRTGIHVQGFVDGGSESFINQVPSPGAAALLGLGAAFASCRRRR